MLVVFGVDAFAFRFAHLLKDDLLGQLCRNTAQAHRGLQEFDFFFHLRVRLYPARFVQGDFPHGIGDFFDDFAERIDVDFTRVRIDAAAEFFVGFEVFAGSDNDRVFDRVDHDLRVDSLLPADLVDCLKKQIRHRYSPLFRAFSSAQSNSSRDS